MASDALQLAGGSLLAGCGWFGLLAGVAVATVRLRGGTQLALEPFLRWALRVSVLVSLAVTPLILASWYLRDWSPDLGLFGHWLRPYLHKGQASIILGLGWVTAALAWAQCGAAARRGRK
jgi:hypothetical protein